MNKEIYDSEIELPENYRDHLKVCFQKLKNPDKNSEGYKRNQELQNQRFIGYPQLKRIKNFFDNFKGNQNDKRTLNHRKRHFNRNRQAW